MTIYLKITTAMLMSAVLIEFNGAYSRSEGYGRFVMAFLYAGMLLAGAFFIVSAAEKFARRQRAKSLKKPARTAKAKNEARQLQPLYGKMKIAG